VIQAVGLNPIAVAVELAARRRLRRAVPRAHELDEEVGARSTMRPCRDNVETLLRELPPAVLASFKFSKQRVVAVAKLHPGLFHFNSIRMSTDIANFAAMARSAVSSIRFIGDAMAVRLSLISAICAAVPRNSARSPSPWSRGVALKLWRIKYFKNKGLFDIRIIGNPSSVT
jgi:hypothetical protein